MEIAESDSQRVREMLSRWVEAGHIIRIKRGVYMTQRFYNRHESHSGFHPAVSAIITPQSYLSLEFILQRASILSHVAYPVTAITPKNSRRIDNVLGTFLYRHMKNSLYTGFTSNTFFGVIFSQASVAKALFDYLYFRPLPRSLQSHKINYAEELRLNLEALERNDREEFANFIKLSDSPKMRFYLENVRRKKWRQ